MPGFPLGAAKKIMAGLFTTARSVGTGTTTLQLYSSGTTGLGFPNATSSNATGFGDLATPTAAAAGAVVDLYIGLIKGTDTALVVDTIFNETTGVMTGATVEADYSGYKRVRLTSTPTATGPGATSIFTPGNSGSLAQIQLSAQLTFPTCAIGAGGANAGSLTTNNIVGFFISTNHNRQSVSAPTDIDIIAFGALSSIRSITGSDTPIFTQNAITITLD